LVEHGDLLRMRKQAQEGLLVKFERERELTNTLLISYPYYSHFTLEFNDIDRKFR
jgi:hypothetical protein